MKSRLAWFCLLIGCMAGTFTFALGGFGLVATNAGVFNRIQAELDVYPSVGISREELALVQEDVSLSLRLGALLNNRMVTTFGVRGRVFNDQEMAHMKDVIRLFVLQRKVREGALHVTLLCMPCIFIVLRIQRRRGSMRSPLWASTGFIALGVWLLAGLIFAAASGFNFEVAFVRFHEILFTNDLWQLDPRTSAMIRMYPAEFFMAIGRDIGIRMALFALGFAAVVFAGFYPWEGLRHGTRACENPGD